ncbi:hypothetical protein V8E53_001688 [Lactarius tabidus]
MTFLDYLAGSSDGPTTTAHASVRSLAKRTASNCTSIHPIFVSALAVAPDYPSVKPLPVTSSALQGTILPSGRPHSTATVRIIEECTKADLINYNTDPLRAPLDGCYDEGAHTAVPCRAVVLRRLANRRPAPRSLSQKTT